MTRLVEIKIKSIYVAKDGTDWLPKHLAKCPPETKTAIENIAKALQEEGNELVLTDLFRSYEIQMQAHMDYVSKKKKAYSPAPGGSMHEAGRAMDIDLSKCGDLARFWEIAESFGFTPIIPKADKKTLEAWHFDHAGTHRIIYDYYVKNGYNEHPYKMMAKSAILESLVAHPDYGDRSVDALIQSYLIRLGENIGKMDGIIGERTKSALRNFGIPDAVIKDKVSTLNIISQKYLENKK